MIGFPILYQKRKFMGNLPEISDFYNFYEVFTHFLRTVLQVKKLDILFLCAFDIPFRCLILRSFIVFTLIYHCQKKVSGKPITPPPLSLKVLINQQVPASTQHLGNVYYSASHFGRALSVSEIQRLRRLMREGSPERISRS